MTLRYLEDRRSSSAAQAPGGNAAAAAPTAADRPSPKPARPRYRALGGFRLALALLVVAQHFQYLLPDASRWPFRRWGFGIIAVDLFFAISGFVIAEANAEIYPGRAGRFVLNRLLRVVPPYLAALTVAACAHAALWSAGCLRLWDYSVVGPPVTVASVAKGVLDIFPLIRHRGSPGGDFEFIPFAWSLRVELLFYLVAFATYGLMTRPPRRVSPKRWSSALGALSLLASLLLFAGFLVGRLPALVGNAPFFVFGVALYFQASGRGRWATGLAAASALASVVAFLRLRSPSFPWIPQEQSVLLVALGTVFVALLAIPSLSALPRRLDRFAGELSYPLYLNHYVVGILIYDLTSERSLRIYALAATISVVAARLMSVVVETPLAHLRNRVRGASL